MRANPHYDQREHGMLNACVTSSNPLLLYYHTANLMVHQGPHFDLFERVLMDDMYDLMFAAVKEPYMWIAQRVACDKEAKKRFKQACLALSEQKVRDFDMTLWRERDGKETCKSDFLSALANGSLYAREYEQALPVLAILFDHAGPVELMDRLIPVLVDWASYVCSFQMDEWPINASGEWWSGLRQFGIDTYEKLQKLLPGNHELAPCRNLIKLHQLLDHGLETRRLFLRLNGTQVRSKQQIDQLDG
jgi:hypothetical protein